MRKIRAVLAVLALTLGVGVPLSLATAPPASALGWVANSCAVTAKVTYLEKVGSGGYIRYLGCGQGDSNVVWATVKDHPFYVRVNGASMCLRPGQLFYPNSSGAVLTPTVRC